MSAREKLAELRELAEKATPGPWKLWGMQVLADPVGDSNLSTALPIADTTDPHRGLRTFNARLIAESRTELPRVVGALEAVLDLIEAEERATAAYLVEHPEQRREVPPGGLLLTVDLRAVIEEKLR